MKSRFISSKHILIQFDDVQTRENFLAVSQLPYADDPRGILVANNEETVNYINQYDYTTVSVPVNTGVVSAPTVSATPADTGADTGVAPRTVMAESIASGSVMDLTAQRSVSNFSTETIVGGSVAAAPPSIAPPSVAAAPPSIAAAPTSVVEDRHQNLPQSVVSGSVGGPLSQKSVSNFSTQTTLDLTEAALASGPANHDFVDSAPRFHLPYSSTLGRPSDVRETFKPIASSPTEEFELDAELFRLRRSIAKIEKAMRDFIAFSQNSLTAKQIRRLDKICDYTRKLRQSIQPDL